MLFTTSGTAALKTMAANHVDDVVAGRICGWVAEVVGKDGGEYPQ